MLWLSSQHLKRPSSRPSKQCSQILLPLPSLICWHGVVLQGGGVASGGLRDMIPTISRTAVACGVEGLFMEVHDNPVTSPVDGPTQWPLRCARHSPTQLASRPLAVGQCASEVGQPAAMRVLCFVWERGKWGGEGGEENGGEGGRP